MNVNVTRNPMYSMSKHGATSPTGDVIALNSIILLKDLLYFYQNQSASTFINRNPTETIIPFFIYCHILRQDSVPS